MGFANEFNEPGEGSQRPFAPPCRLPGARRCSATKNQEGGTLAGRRAHWHSIPGKSPALLLSGPNNHHKFVPSSDHLGRVISRRTPDLADDGRAANPVAMGVGRQRHHHALSGILEVKGFSVTGTGRIDLAIVTA